MTSHRNQSTFRLADALSQACSLLGEFGVSFALSGGLAVGCWAEPRFTSDVDLSVAVSLDEQAEEVVRFMLSRGYSLRQVFQHKETKRILTVRLYRPNQPDLFTDLLFGTSGVEDLIVGSASTVEVFPGQFIPVALRGHLVGMKMLSYGEERPKDQADIISLLGGCSPRDLSEARDIVKQMENRGTRTERNLSEELEGFIAKYLEAAPPLLSQDTFSNS